MSYKLDSCTQFYILHQIQKLADFINWRHSYTQITKHITQGNMLSYKIKKKFKKGYNPDILQIQYYRNYIMKLLFGMYTIPLVKISADISFSENQCLFLCLRYIKEVKKNTDKIKRYYNRTCVLSFRVTSKSSVWSRGIMKVERV